MATTDAPSSRGLSVPGETPRRPPPTRRTIRIRGREYPVFLPSLRDPRLHVAAARVSPQGLRQAGRDLRRSAAPIVFSASTVAAGVPFLELLPDRVFLER